MIGLLSVFAQLERAQIAERMAIGIEGRAKKGKWITKLSFDPKYIEKIKEDAAIDNEKPRQIELINKHIKELSAQISRYSYLYSLGSMDMDEVKAQYSMFLLRYTYSGEILEK